MDEKKRTVIRGGISAFAVGAVSGLVRIYGLSDKVFFNKGVISAGIFLLSMGMVERSLGEFQKNKRRAAAAFLLSFLLAFTEILGTGLRLLVNGAAVSLSPLSVLWIAASSAILAFWGQPFFFWLMTIGRNARAEVGNGRNLNKVFFISWIIVFLGYLPCFLAFFPGLYCYDMIWQWEMFASRIYNTHHPILHTIMSGGILELGKSLWGSYNAGLALHSVIQLGILSGSIAFAIRYMVKIQIPRKVCGAAMIFYVLFPFFPVLGISTTKDVVFGCLFLTVFVCLCDMVTERRIYRGWKLVFFAAVSILMGSFRNNAVYGLVLTEIIFLIACVILRLRNKSNRFVLQIFTVILISIVGVQAALFAMEKKLQPDKGSVAEILSIPCQQLARTFVFHKEEMNPADREELALYIQEEAMSKYKYYVSDPVKARLSVDYLKEHKREFLALWLRLGKQFPGEFILAPVYNTMGIWYMGGDSSCYMEYKMSPPFDEEHVVKMHSLLPALKRYYSWFTDQNIQKSLPVLSLLFYTSFYAWMFLICTVVMIERKNYSHLILSAVLFGYLASLIPGPCIIVRYMMGVILCTPVLLSVTFYMKNTELDH